MQFQVLCILLAISSAFCFPKQDDEWELFKKMNSKFYEAEEDMKRKLIWSQTVEEVAAHNRQYDLGLETYHMAVNQFADMSVEEFLEKFTGAVFVERNETLAEFHDASDLSALADAVDWRRKGVVTGVKNQGACGSCWAFSTTGSLEGQHALRTGKLVSLSEQNLVDCSYPEGNQGCNGGWMDQGFNYVLHHHGIDTESSYPYHASVGRCAFNANSIGATIRSYRDVRGEANLQHAIATVGPISVAIQVTGNFMRYGGGIFNDRSCGGGSMNHAVLAVGYGGQGGSQYYIVKNSWGGGWGEQGYIRMIRNQGNRCAIASGASYPIV